MHNSERNSPSIGIVQKLTVVAFFSLVLAICFPKMSVAQTQSNSQSQANSKTWAIVIHGGAGGDHRKWSEEKAAARKAGLERSLKAGSRVLAEGGTALDAVRAAIIVMENDASFNAGRGAVKTEDGKVELDASIMDGKTRQCGAVAGITAAKNPILAATKVMTSTKHVLLVGPGADEFVKQRELEVVAPDYFLSRFQNRYNRDADPTEPHLGTVGCVALDQDGNLAAGTSTGGTSKKLPGRVGDSPIVGAGTYADNATCAVSGTGIGEEYIRNAVAYNVSAQMAYLGNSIHEAVDDNLWRRLKKGDGGIIAVDRNGEMVMQHNSPSMSCGAADGTGRFETHFAFPRYQNKDSDSGKAEIQKLLDQQVTDWNAGNIDGFMEAYWKSDQLAFASGGKVTKGWQATLDGYKKRYPDKATMGKLQFSDLEFSALGSNAMQVIGTWELEREESPIGGKFTLVLKRFPEGWRIVHDHTSALE